MYSTLTSSWGNWVGLVSLMSRLVNMVLMFRMHCLEDTDTAEFMKGSRTCLTDANKVHHCHKMCILVWYQWHKTCYYHLLKDLTSKRGKHVLTESEQTGRILVTPYKEMQLWTAKWQC